MPSLLDDQPPTLGGTGISSLLVQQPDPDQTDQGRALAALYNGITAEMERQQQIAQQQGQWTGGSVFEGGHPTMQGLTDAARQYTGALVAGTGAPEAGEGLLGINAYHGSPYSFDRFDTSKIGTGEGAQAYGHGLYFAENEGVAKSYRDTLTEPNLPTPTSISGKPTYDLWNKYADESGGLTIDGVKWYGPRDFIRNLQQGRTTLEGAPPDLAAALQSHVNQGSMYQVGIQANPEHFLDWDKTVNQQSPGVRDKLLDLGYGDAQKAHEVYYHMAGGRGGDVEASQRLQDAGIPGIRYLDAGSRGAGQGSSNYVVFNDSIINILRKYGIAGLMAGGGAAGMAGGQQQQ